MFKKNCIVNGKEFPIDKMEFHLEELVKKFIKDKKTKVAVAVNNKIIVKSEWRKKRIFNGDIIEIVQPFFEGNLKNLDKLKIDGKFFNSRLILGTASFPNIDVLNKSIEKSECEIVTTSVRRLNLNQKDFFLDQIKKNILFFQIPLDVSLKKEAVLTAELARESMNTDWIKLELIGDDEMLLPDPIELYSTCETLIKKSLKFFATAQMILFYAKDLRI